MRSGAFKQRFACILRKDFAQAGRRRFTMPNIE
jgi:hypothetical protein